MKKFLICLLSFLIAFGVSVAVAGVYIQDFEDGLDPPWEAYGNYEIVDGKFHMVTGSVPEGGDYIIGDVWATIGNEFVYKFEGATQMVPDEFCLHPSIYYRNPNMIIELSFYGWPHGVEQMEIWVHLYKTDGSVESEYWGDLTSGAWYYWSITAHTDHVTIEINNEIHELFDGEFQRPPSVSESVAIVHGVIDAGLGYNVEYFADNLVAYTATGETIYEVVDSVEEWIDEEDLEGIGAGASADGRLTAFENMLTNARVLFENGDIAGACDQLEAASRKCDGQSPPPDFVEGDAVITELQEMLTTLINDFGCE